jgi:DNA-binding transcriptional LysR family regulator
LQYPDLEIRTNLTNRRVDLIEEGYDLAIRLGLLDDSSMMAKKLGSRKLYVCASPDYVKRAGTPSCFTELESHNCLLGTLDYWRFEENGKIKNIKVRGSITCNSGHSLVDAAIKGIGLTQLPDYYVLPYIASGKLVSVLENYQPAEEGIWALYPNNRHLSPKVRMLLDHLAESL